LGPGKIVYDDTKILSLLLVVDAIKSGIVSP
jgi:hypothetical protein